MPDDTVPTLPGSRWATDHTLHLFNQIERRPTPAADSQGQHWTEARKTGLVIAVCNCGYSSGWIPRSKLPGRLTLLAQHGTPLHTEHPAGPTRAEIDLAPGAPALTRMLRESIHRGR